MPSEGSLRYDFVSTPRISSPWPQSSKVKAFSASTWKPIPCTIFQEKVCLLQLASSKRYVVVDTIALNDLSP